MNSVQVYIDETLGPQGISIVKSLVMGIPHVHNVEMNASVPHEMVVEYDEHFNIPISIMEKLEGAGIHPDIISA